MPQYNLPYTKRQMVTSSYSATVGTSATTVFPGTTGNLTELFFMRIWNVSSTATVWLSRTGTAVVGAAGSFPLGPGLSETWVFPQAIPTNALSAIATAAGTPLTVEVG